MRYWEPEDSPYYDMQPHRGRWRSFVRTLIIVNIAIFAIEFLVSFAGRERFYGWFEPFGLSPRDALLRGHVWQLVTYAFLHDPVRLTHILFNMLFLYLFGVELENTWGSRRFLWFYLGAAIFSGLCFSLVEFTKLGRADSWCIGASGAVYALVMAYRLYWPDRVLLFMFIFPMRVKTLVWIVIAMETYSVLVSNKERGGVANTAHLGGLLFGYLAIRFAPALSGLVRSGRSGRWEPSSDDERRRDEILDKISREGINSLTWWDRRFLRRFRRD